MTDHPANNDPSADSIGGPDLQTDVDSLLAETSALAADLGHDLGADSPMATPQGAAPAETDANLEQVEQLLDQTVEELGSQDNQAATSGDPPQPESPPAAEDDDEVARVFASLEEEPTASQTEESAQESDGAQADSGPDYLADESAATAQVEPTQPADPPIPKPNRQPLKALAGKIMGPLASALLGLLDWMDRPFTAIGYQTRIILGYVAVVTLVAACCVMLLAS
ncbi:MAG: hypothetical protein ACE5GE_17620 [Phycisphaerae bacterium]